MRRSSRDSNAARRARVAGAARAARAVRQAVRPGAVRLVVDLLRIGPPRRAEPKRTASEVRSGTIPPLNVVKSTLWTQQDQGRNPRHTRSNDGGLGSDRR